MNARARSVRNSRVVVSIAVAGVLFWGFGCVWLKSAQREVRDNAIPGLFAVGGYVVAAPLGGVAVPIIIFGSSVLGNSITRSIAYSSGEVVGEEALRKEVVRLRSWASEAEGQKLELRSKVDTLGFILKILGAWTIIKYCWPKSRAAQNFWRGVLGFFKRERGSLRKIVSATGVAHTKRIQ